ncbi:hypothetical protein NKG05_07585 [Oerskovia sp. M15]
MLARGDALARARDRVDRGRRRLFAVDLRAPGCSRMTGRGSRGVSRRSSARPCASPGPAVPVGGAGWYLDRPGFAWGGIGVAACWWGGAVGLARELYAATGRRDPDQLALAHLGAVDVALAGARTTLVEASRIVDGAPAEGSRRGPGPQGARRGRPGGGGDRAALLTCAGPWTVDGRRGLRAPGRRPPALRPAAPRRARRRLAGTRPRRSGSAPW